MNIEHFNPNEDGMRCRCDRCKDQPLGWGDFSDKLMAKIDAAREILGSGIIVNSGARCMSHYIAEMERLNKPAKARSGHLFDVNSEEIGCHRKVYALDVRPATASMIDLQIAIEMQGWNCIIPGKTFIHIDMLPRLARLYFDKRDRKYKSFF